jgi:hypothetical protein
MANSYIEYTGNGLNDTYLIPFPFLRDFHINAQIDEVDVSGFSVVGTFVEFDTAPDNDAVVKIFRVTPRDGVITQYTDGGTPTAKDLLEASLQALYISQEIEDGTLSGSSVIADNSLILSKLQQITSQHLLGRKSSLTGNVEQLSVADAKTMLGVTSIENNLGNSASRNIGTTAGTVAAGDDSRIVNALQDIAGITQSPTGKITLNGTDPSISCLILGGWSYNTAYNFGLTSYQASTDQIVIAQCHEPDSTVFVEAYTDSASNPTNRVCRQKFSGGGTITFTFPVKKGHYWRLQRYDSSTTADISIIPLAP